MVPQSDSHPLSTPIFIAEAMQINAHLKTLTTDDIQTKMNVSSKLAEITQKTIHDWISETGNLTSAIETFRGDIFSGLQVQTWSNQDHAFADENLKILSGLYGILRPHDAIAPYRLEMGYKLAPNPNGSLYSFWDDKIASRFKPNETFIDLTAVEYGKTMKARKADSIFIRPKFLTMHPTKKAPTFVTVHAKIARGAFASWDIKNRMTSVSDITSFTELGYSYNPLLSTDIEPVFVCHEFKGLGLSVRLNSKQGS